MAAAAAAAAAATTAPPPTCTPAGAFDPLLEVRLPTRSRIFISAPHNMRLHRDGHDDHQDEVYTSTLAHKFGQHLGAGSVCWAAEVRKRVRESGSAEAAARDPNFLLRAELDANGWNAALRAVRAGLGGADARCLHVDLHGARDPPHWEVDVQLGLGAMEQAEAAAAGAGAGAGAGAAGEAVKLRRALEARLRPMLAAKGWDLQAGGAETARPTLNGVATPDRFTMTEQSVAVGYSHAIQVEMSYRLRKAMVEEPELREAFAAAISVAWSDCVF